MILILELLTYEENYECFRSDGSVMFKKWVVTKQHNALISGIEDRKKTKCKNDMCI